MRYKKDNSNKKCKICEIEFTSLRGLGLHLLQKHNLKLIEYYIDYENFIIPKCSCGENLKYIAGITFQATCGENECQHKNNLSYKASDETKLKISNIMKKNFKDGKLVGWAINSDINRRSYPEKFFIELMKNNDLYSKYTIKEKFSFGKYFLDFAFLELKLDLEIDGQQHFITETAIEYDMERDNFLINSGWKVYRISWIELRKNPKIIFDNFINWLKDNDNLYYKYNVEEILSKLKPKKIKCEKINKEEIISIILNSKIIFTESGWLKKITNLLEEKIELKGCKNPYLFIKINMTDLYDKCHKKNKNKKIIHKQQSVYFSDRKRQYNEKILPIVNKINNCSIDFTKEGWVKDVSKIIGISENKGGWWMKKNMKKFYDEKCWKRKSLSSFNG